VPRATCDSASVLLLLYLLWTLRHCMSQTCQVRWLCAAVAGTAKVKGGGGGDDDGNENDKDGDGGRYSVLVQYHAPCIMPWLWDEAAPSADPRMRPSHISLRAGSRGAF
jgi:hypothetical protein